MRTTYIIELANEVAEYDGAVASHQLKTRALLYGVGIFLRRCASLADPNNYIGGVSFNWRPNGRATIPTLRH